MLGFDAISLYVSKLPLEAVEKDVFYCRPLPSAPADTSKPWYSAVPIGRNTLTNMVPSMCEEAGISGEKTNHSLWVTGTSALFDAGVPEKIIQGCTGHRSLDASQVYERVTEEQDSKVSKILSGSMEKFEGNGHVTSSNSTVPFTPATANPASTAQYNNCTVNMYQIPPPQQPLYFSPWMMSPFPSYPSYSIKNERHRDGTLTFVAK